MASKKVKVNKFNANDQVQDHMTMEQLKNKFEESISGMVLVIDAAIRNSNRIDILVNAYETMDERGMEPDVHMAQVTVNQMADDLENLREIVSDLRFVDFCKEDMDDPFKPFIPDREGITTKEQMYDAYTTWEVYRPFGEKVENLHRMVFEEFQKIENSKED